MTYVNQDFTEHQHHILAIMYQDKCELCAEITGCNLLKGIDEQFKDKMFSANARQNSPHNHISIEDLI